MSSNPHLHWTPPISLLGVPFDHVTTQQTLQLFQGMIASRQPHYIATANVDFLVQASHDVELCRILHEAHLVLCDGMPLVWASRLLGNPLPERVAGSDLAPLLLEQAEKSGHSVFFLGGVPDVTAKAVENVRARHPQLKIAGMLSPKFAPLLDMDHSAIRRAVHEARPDILLVSFGCPKQEKWISMNYRSLGVPVCIGVGATIDFLAGSMKRAPRWMQRLGLEWCFRLLQEPRRLFKRYLTDMMIFGKDIATQFIAVGNPTHSTPEEAVLKKVDDHCTLELPEHLNLAWVRHHRSLWDKIRGQNETVLLVGRRVLSVDSTALALMTRLGKDLRRHGKSLVLVEPSARMKRALRLVKAGALIDSCDSLDEATQLLETRTAERRFNVLPHVEQVHIINWQGEVTAANAQQIWNQTEQFLASREKAGLKTLTVDLSSVRFVDSTGVGLMVRAKKRCADRGIAVHFKHPSHAASMVIRTLRMESFLLAPSPTLAA